MKKIILVFITLLVFIESLFSQPVPKKNGEKTKIEFNIFEKENMVEIIPMGQKKTLYDFAGTKGSQDIFGYSIGKYEVTQTLYRSVMGTNPSYHKGDKLPVECVTWYDAVFFCNELTKMTMGEENCCYTITDIEKTDAGVIKKASVSWNQSKKGYRLPTEAEWEYAARGGSKGGWDYKYSGSDNLKEVAWCYYNSGNPETGIKETQPVGTKKANKAGLYDMTGNVNEWCCNTQVTKSEQPYRGCHFKWDAIILDLYVLTNREWQFPDCRYNNYGFRICRSLSNEWTGKINLTQVKKQNETIIKEYPISYELNGGTNASTNKDSYLENATVILDAPTRSGYRFDGWYWDKDLKDSVKENTFSNKKGALKVYAKWLKQIDFASFESENMVEIIPADSKVTLEDFAGTKDPQDIYTYFIGKFEVTQVLYKEIMGENPSYFISDNNPVENVSWYDAVFFCNKLTKMTMGEENCCYTITNIQRNMHGEISGAHVEWDVHKKGYRLPTEVEWELAARGGLKGGWNFKYAGSDNIEEVAWYRSETTHPVGTKKSNMAGLYDMSGNVEEWCWNTYNRPSYYVRYGNGVSRGGNYNESDCKVSRRKKYDSYYNCGDLGFRICRSLYNEKAKSLDLEYPIIYELNGGTNSSSNKNTYIEEEFIYLAAPTKSGYKFDGWYWDKELKNPVAGNTISNKRNSLKVYAKWLKQMEFASFESENMVEIISAGSKVTLEDFAGTEGAQDIFAYSMGKYEVTQELYQEIIGSNPSKHKGEKLPVENVTWYDAIYFCNELTKRTMGEENCYYTITNIRKYNDGSISKAEVNWNRDKKGYRLPTAAEWEYASRGGSKGGWNFEYAGSDDIEEVAWYRNNSNAKTHDVGTKKANMAGLYDMSGNVEEWCGSIWRNISSGLVSRGGDCFDLRYECSVSTRSIYSPDGSHDSRGFRICRSLGTEKNKRYFY